MFLTPIEPMSLSNSFSYYHLLFIQFNQLSISYEFYFIHQYSSVLCWFFLLQRSCGITSKV